MFFMQLMLRLCTATPHAHAHRLCFVAGFPFQSASFSAEAFQRAKGFTQSLKAKACSKNCICEDLRESAGDFSSIVSCKAAKFKGKGLKQKLRLRRSALSKCLDKFSICENLRETFPR
jgi:hypothetical protein